MKDYLANKTVGFYVTVVATILAIIGVAIYASASGALAMVFGLVVAAIVIEVVLIVVSGVIGNKPFLNLVSSINAILLGYAIVTSFNSQVDSLGMVVSGLYSIEQVKSFLIFVGFAAVAMVLYIVASFMTLGKRE